MARILLDTQILNTGTVFRKYSTPALYSALPNALVLTYQYNDAHRLQSITDNLGNHIDYGYDLRGNRTDEDVFDSSSTLKRAVDYTFDIRNRVDTINSGGFVTDLNFDSTGTLKDETDANTALTKYTYDYLYRLTKTMMPPAISQAMAVIPMDMTIGVG